MTNQDERCSAGNVPELVSMRQLAKELGLGLPAARRVARELSAYLMIQPGRQQMESRQRSYCWTRAQADQLLEERERRGFRTARGPLKPWVVRGIVDQ
jgi:hypothetical protein